MNPIYLFSFSLIVFLVITLIGIRKSPKFPKIHSVHVLFRERFLSGRSKGILSSYRNVLEVVVTEQELWIRPFILFFPFAVLSNHIHQIPIASIRGIETRGNGETTVYFLSEQGKAVHFSFYFNKTDQFIQAIEQLNKSVKVQRIH